ncbi:protein-export protein SecB [Striga asiatica]|uniref:Protein-export protein SecB n=1 Tax=Striga asiatica TaxID=4170 RepID=A0A5A7RH98_STRAF|nr:protein-export protein SecB [Striga asiatica]
MLKLSSVRAARPHPPIIGRRDRYTDGGKVSPSMNLETKTLKAGSPLFIMCVNETATLDILTVAATCPIKSRSVFGVSAILSAQEINIISEPAANDSVEHLLVVDVEDHVQAPPRSEIDPDLQPPRRLRRRRRLLTDRLRSVGLKSPARDHRSLILVSTVREPHHHPRNMERPRERNGGAPAGFLRRQRMQSRRAPADGLPHPVEKIRAMDWLRWQLDRRYHSSNSSKNQKK